jgi:hypothetical protein
LVTHKSSAGLRGRFRLQLFLAFSAHPGLCPGSHSHLLTASVAGFFVCFEPGRQTALDLPPVLAQQALDI